MTQDQTSHALVVETLSSLGGRTDALTLGNALIATGMSTKDAQLAMQRAGDDGAVVYEQDWTIRVPGHESSRTFAMIKPDATIRQAEHAMLHVMKQDGFRVLRSRRETLSREDAEWLYREHAARDHFSALVDYTVSGDVVLLELERSGRSAATDFRRLMGATDRTKADPGTLRAIFAVGYRENSIHGSDSAEAAEAELAHFFPDQES